MSEASTDLKIGVGLVIVLIVLLSLLLVFFLATDWYPRRRIDGMERTRDYCVSMCRDRGYTESSCMADPWAFCFKDATTP